MLESRRSANNLLPVVRITQEDLRPIFEDVKLTPLALNLQHTKYVVVMDEEMKEQIRVAAFQMVAAYTQCNFIVKNDTFE